MGRKAKELYAFDKGEHVEFIREPGRPFEVLSRYRSTDGPADSLGAVSLGERIPGGTGWRPLQADPRDIRTVAR